MGTNKLEIMLFLRLAPKIMIFLRPYPKLMLFLSSLNSQPPQHPPHPPLYWVSHVSTTLTAVTVLLGGREGGATPPISAKGGRVSALPTTSASTALSAYKVRLGLG